ncbi:MAG: hypothetical protein A4E66_01677 [Syntrophus sp. PtaB.Bin001]|nr:MAG: hypothetical protein A4E66_01677 [Syntrophus sp. PtaB.Bin001]
MLIGRQELEALHPQILHGMARLKNIGSAVFKAEGREGNQFLMIAAEPGSLVIGYHTGAFRRILGKHDYPIHPLRGKKVNHILRSEAVGKAVEVAGVVFPEKFLHPGRPDLDRTDMYVEIDDFHVFFSCESS